LARNERLKRNLPSQWSSNCEEIVASLLGSLLVADKKDQEDLVMKAVFDAESSGLAAKETAPLILELRELLERFL
jgi:hypothetical protein